jgi:uncharacterized protein YggE
MKMAFIVALTMLAVTPGLCRGQVGGNAVYGQAGGKARAEQSERNKRVVAPAELPPTNTSTFVEANVLMNVKADEYVALFAVAREAPTVAECGQKMDATLKAFTDRLKTLGVAGDALYVDFVAQETTYGFEVTGDIAKEVRTGFELKKNVSVHYRNPALLDRLLGAAAQSEIFDLIKVDYVVKDAARIEDQLMEEAARIIEQKTARYERLLGLKLPSPPQIYAERSAVHYPTTMYDSYAANESETMSNNAYRQRYTVQSARKTRTFFFNGLDGDGFDAVINPVVIEPVVQFTLYLKVRFDIAPSLVK